MKDLGLLVFLSQLGLSVALPLVGFVWLGVWLGESWGNWAVFAGILLGVFFGFQGLRSALKTMENLAKKPEGEEPPRSYNEHD